MVSNHSLTVKKVKQVEATLAEFDAQMHEGRTMPAGDLLRRLEALANKWVNEHATMSQQGHEDGLGSTAKTCIARADRVLQKLIAGNLWDVERGLKSSIPDREVSGKSFRAHSSPTRVS